MTLETVTDNSFAHFVQNPLVFVAIGAPWCGPCKPVKKILESLAGEFPNVKFGYLDSDAPDSLKTTLELQIQGIPTVLVFKAGEPVAVAFGLKPKRYFLDLIQQHA